MATRKRQFVVAIVDDDAELRRAVGDLLSSNGFRSRSYSSAEQFLRSRQGWQSGCLILDVRLPGMSGLQLHRALTAKGFAIPVIFITAENDIFGQLSQADALAILRKPCDPEELLRLVRVASQAPPTR